MSSLSPTRNPATPPRPRWGRKVLVRLAFVGFSVLLAVIAVEVAGRILFREMADDSRYYPRIEEHILRTRPILESSRHPGDFDPKFGYILSPNKSFTEARGDKRFMQCTNSLGFYTGEIRPRRLGEYRVMLIGDSFFYGSFIEDEERLGIQLEQMARKDPEARRPLRVYNFARPGYTSVQELIVARTYAPQVDPDCIILGFFAANDVIANAVTRIDEQENYVPVPDQVRRYRTELRSALGPLRHSIIGRIVSLTTLMGSRLYYQIARQPWVLERNYEVLSQVRDHCRQHGYRFGVVFQHTRDSLDTGMRATCYGSAEVHDSLDRFCDESGIAYIDLREIFHKAGDWRRFIHNPPDSHTNALGTRKTAEAIYQRMIRSELIRPIGTEDHALMGSNR